MYIYINCIHASIYIHIYEYVYTKVTFIYTYKCEYQYIWIGVMYLFSVTHTLSVTVHQVWVYLSKQLYQRMELQRVYCVIRFENV